MQFAALWHGFPENSVFEGADVANLGSRNVRGKDLMTMARGARVPFDKHVSFGASYVHSIGGTEDIFEQRVTAMLLLEY